MNTVTMENSTNQETSSEESPHKLNVSFKPLSERVIALTLTIGKFSGLKKDKKATEDTVSRNGTTSEYVRVTKTLMKSESMSEVTNAAQNLRNQFYKLTTVWDREGCGIVKTSNYLKVKVQLEELIRVYEMAAGKLIDGYDNLITQDKINLGHMFNMEDYPSKDSLRASFYAKLGVKAIEKNDFRSDILDQADVAKINREIEDRINDCVKTAQQANIERVKENLAHLVNRLIDVDGKFHQSAIEGVKVAIREAKDLNLDDNPDMDNLFETIQMRMDLNEAATIRVNAKVRDHATKIAQQSLSDLDTFMADFMGKR